MQVWLRDPPPENIPAVDYSGCLGVPRLVTHLPGARLVFQQPLPELRALRSARMWAAETALEVDGVTELAGMDEQDHLDCELTLTRCELN